MHQRTRAPFQVLVPGISFKLASKKQIFYIDYVIIEKSFPFLSREYNRQRPLHFRNGQFIENIYHNFMLKILGLDIKVKHILKMW